VPQQPEPSSKVPPTLTRRSRTDSIVVYTPPSITEAPGSTFYIKRSGEIDYVVLLKVRKYDISTLFKAFEIKILEAKYLVQSTESSTIVQ